ncbi:MAG: antibiotic biosynthesis monooxygenase [Acidimicrobiaceae bacterium]|nr:antibiotic biosynthesis monooxygenase [Acidimicrobiaceae bacterium]
MLVVAGSFQVDPARRDEFVESRKEAMATSRGEKGCHEYIFAPDPIDPGRVVLYERWESPEDLAAHLTAMRARERAGGSAPAVPVISSDVLQYNISGSGPVGG